jgi:hypothetical protein
MLFIRTRVGDALATGCIFFSLRSVSAERSLLVWLTRRPDRYEFALESGHDEQAAANSHNIFKRGDHQVGGFEGLH